MDVQPKADARRGKESQKDKGRCDEPIVRMDRVAEYKIGSDVLIVFLNADDAEKKEREEKIKSRNYLWISNDDVAQKRGIYPIMSQGY